MRVGTMGQLRNEILAQRHHFRKNTQIWGITHANEWTGVGDN